MAGGFGRIGHWTCIQWKHGCFSPRPPPARAGSAPPSGLPQSPASSPACGTGSSGSPSSPEPRDGKPADGVAVELSLTSADAAELADLQEQLTELSSLTATGLVERHEVPFTELGYDPLEAAGLDLIQASSVGLNAAGTEALQRQGFVVTRQHEFPSFVFGYTTIYSEDLPVYISADSILDAVHRSYDDVLRTLEEVGLVVELTQLLEELRGKLGSVGDASVRADLDVYLTVAASMLRGEVLTPAHGGDAAQVERLVEQANSAQGMQPTTLFGVDRVIDFSQFKPRGHYTDSPTLEQYFRAMMWLGRIDFRMIETQPDGSQVFSRSQFDATVALGGLVEASARERFDRIDGVIEAFVGESDYMTLPQVAEMLESLGSAQAAAGLSDTELAQALIDGGWGAQRIASHFMVNDGSTATLPLNRSFALFGQRYVLDSHVFSNVTWDRTAAQRMLPDPLDVAFAALGNDHAASLLEPQLEQYAYAPNLAQVRLLADRHGDEFWGANLYNIWLSSLRALSPGGFVAEPSAVGLPSVAGTEAWGRRLLNTQLSSWAQLRHDTILYAKQSYTTGAACEFPDAYVDPYPEFYAALRRFAEKGASVTELLEGTVPGATLQRVSDYFAELHAVTALLEEMAEYQRAGTPFTEEHMTFVNDTVGFAEGGCVPEGSRGWYARLFFDRPTSSNYDPVVADVHTQPTDEVGNMVGNVLHVGTGMARLMVVTADTCTGPKAYAGLAASYHELVTSNFERLDDEAWKERLRTEPPADVPWLTPVLAE